MFDVPQTNIRKYFNTSCQYLETALQNKGNNYFIAWSLVNILKKTESSLFGIFCHSQTQSSKFRASFGSLFNGNVKKFNFSSGLHDESDEYDCRGRNQKGKGSSKYYVIKRCHPLVCGNMTVWWRQCWDRGGWSSKIWHDDMLGGWKCL